MIEQLQQIDIGDELILQAIDPYSGSPRHYSAIVEALSEEKIGVSLAVGGIETPHFEAGKTIGVSLWKGYADHRFKTRVISYQTGHCPELILMMPLSESIMRIPRRRHFRVSTRLDATLYYRETKEWMPLKAMLLDLGVKGCRLIVDKRFAIGTSLRLDFDLSFSVETDKADQTVCVHQISGEVKIALLPYRQQKDSVADIFILGIAFGKTSTATQHALLHYIAFQERALIRKEVLKKKRSNDNCISQKNLTHQEDPAPGEPFENAHINPFEPTRTS